MQVSVTRVSYPVLVKKGPIADQPWYLRIEIDRGAGDHTTLYINKASDVPANEWVRLLAKIPTPARVAPIYVDGDLIRIEESEDCCGSCVSLDVTLPWQTLAPVLAEALGLPGPPGLGDLIKGAK